MAVPIRTRIATLLLLVVAGVGAWRVTTWAIGFNTELVLLDPAIARTPPVIVDAKTPRLSDRVVLVIVDGLRLDHSRGAALEALRARGVDAVALAPYPTMSRPNYVSLLTGVPPVASGIRVNRVPRPIRVDSIMKRARTAGLRVVTASDIGMIPPLFVDQDTGSTSSGDHNSDGDLFTPGAGLSWPFDEVRKADNGTVNLEVSLAKVLEQRSDLVIVLAGDVDRAGHAHGVGKVYGDAAAEMDAALGRLVARLDLAKDTLIVTADHGHVDRGGHGGPEPEAGVVPLIVAGKGIVPHAQAPGATLLDIAPTIAALLGIPAPGHGHGRALVELLAYEPETSRTRTNADHTRLLAIRELPVPPPSPSWLHLGIAGALLLGAMILAIGMRSAIRVTRASVAGTIAFGFLLAVLVAACRGRLSPSEVPALWRMQRLLAVCGGAGLAIQLVVGWHVVRGYRAPQRLAVANGIALVGLALSLGITCALRGWFARPHIEIPEPEWLVAIPAVQLATVVGSVAIAILLIAALIASRHGATKVVGQSEMS